jgi:hypothetical protein
MTYPLDRGGAWAERRFQSALVLLNDATNFARDTGRDAWDYCLRLEELLSAGLTVADCRWLADKKLVEARDTARARGRGRGIRPLRATFSRSTRFVLTAAGVAFAADLCSPIGRPRAPTGNGNPHRDWASDAMGGPRWDPRLLVLQVDDIAVKEFQAKARNQLVIVSAFDTQGWPRQIDNPLDSGGPAQRAQALADAVHGLNRNLRAKVIRFHTAEKGASVRYELLR